MRDVDKALEQIETRVKRLSGESSLGFSVRAAVSRSSSQAEGPEESGREIILASFVIGPSPRTPTFRFEPLVEPLLDLFVAEFPGSPAVFLRRLVQEGSVKVPTDPRGLIPGITELTLALQPGQKFRAAEGTVNLSGPELVESRRSLWRYNVPWGAVSYLFDTGRPRGLSIPREAFEQIGFYSLEQALWHHVLCPGGMTPDMPPFPGYGIHVLLPCFDARFGKVLLRGNRVEVKIESASGISPSSLRLVLKTYGSSPDAGGVWRLFPPRIWDTLPAVEVSHEYPGPVRAVYALLEFAHGGEPTMAFVDAMSGERAESLLFPQLAVHQHFDLGLSAVEDGLKAVEAAVKKDRSHDLEWATATLLTLAGFQVDWLGYKGKGPQIKSELDLVAYLDRGKLALLGECTLRSADIGRKVSDLVGKAEDVSRLLEGWQVRRVLFTTLRHAAVLPNDRDAAGQVGVSILPAEGLTELLKAVKFAVPTELIWERLAPEVGKGGDYSRLSE